MTPRRKRRLYAALAIIVGVGVAAALGISALQDNLLFYFSPSEVHAGEVPQDHAIRVGGMVVEGSLSREPGSMKVNFVLTDYGVESSLSDHSLALTKQVGQYALELHFAEK